MKYFVVIFKHKDQKKLMISHVINKIRTRIQPYLQTINWDYHIAVAASAILYAWNSVQQIAHVVVFSLWSVIGNQILTEKLHFYIYTIRYICCLGSLAEKIMYELNFCVLIWTGNSFVALWYACVYTEIWEANSPRRQPYAPLPTQ